MINIRLATVSDADVVEALIADCMAESYRGHPGTPATSLVRDVFAPSPPPAPQPRIAIALNAEAEAQGYLAWDATYDPHWGLSGGHVSDLYVAPASRGTGVALALVAYVCAAILAAGGAYLRGEAYDRSSTRQFYSRFAVVQRSGEVALGGRAFRRLASLNGQAVRVILSGLPPVAWNFEY